MASAAPIPASSSVTWNARLRRAHDLDQVERGDGVARLAVDDVVEPALARRARRAPPGRSAAGRRCASGRRCRPRCTSCPWSGSRSRSPSNSSQRLSKRWTSWMSGTLRCRPGVVDEAAHGLAELGQDHLLRLGDGVDREQEQDRQDARRRRASEPAPSRLHLLASRPSSCSSGRMPLRLVVDHQLASELGQQLRHASRGRCACASPRAPCGTPRRARRSAWRRPRRCSRARARSPRRSAPPARPRPWRAAPPCCSRPRPR